LPVVSPPPRLEPDIAMLDIGLPKLDGIELAHALRQMHGHRVTLIACTGNPPTSGCP